MLFDFFASDEVSRLHALSHVILLCASFVDSRALPIASAAGYSGVQDLKSKPCLSLGAVDVLLLSEFSTGYRCSLQS